MLKLSKLTKEYYQEDKKIVAVDHINLSVPKGESCILLGPSGCGKTTTLKMVNRLIEPTSGSIFIGTQDILSLDVIETRRRIGYAVQSIALFPNMTIFENITVVPNLLGWDYDKCQNRAAELLEMVGLPTDKSFQKRFPYQLSGGQQQRIGVIRAMAAKPDILLMDEPFGAIDPINRKQIQEQFRTLQKEHHLTVLFVSHDIDEAIKMGDIIAIFNEGRIEQCASPKDIFSKPQSIFVEKFLGQEKNFKRLRLFLAKEAIDSSVSIKNAHDSKSFVYEHENLLDIISQLYSKGINKILCVDNQKKPLGIITQESIQRLTSIENERQ